VGECGIEHLGEARRFLICGHRWDQHTNPEQHTNVRHTWHARADQLIAPGTEAATFSTSRLFAATYPEAVKIAALIGSLHWRRLAAGNPAQQRHFSAEIGRRLGDPDYRPVAFGDPIAHWMDQDCWQPPSSPTSTYRTSRTFGGPTIPKTNGQSTSRHHRNATRFARNRQGGRIILYHRHLGPVLVRDGSTPMDLFVGTVAATAMTRQSHLPPPETHADPAGPIPFQRPEAAPSDYLTTATEPAPWPPTPQTAGHRGRPLLGRERRLPSRKIAK
jgi:hypothetical protein